VATALLGTIICIGAVQIPAEAKQSHLKKAATGSTEYIKAADNVGIRRLGIRDESGEWKTVRMRVTAYCPCRKCCGEYSDGITACGHRIQSGDVFVAADRRYDFGTEMLIADYNNSEPVTVLDRGGAIRGNRLDVFFGSHKKALQWGVRYIDVKVYEDSGSSG
jgi:3D (Asp-Asp-Asp) domain-containing protein